MKKWWHDQVDPCGIPGGWRCSWFGGLAGLLLLAGCFPQNNLVDDRNPFYLMGLRLRQENKYEEAAEAFEKCLRLSPASAKADLQLAMLCEDRLGDPIRAIYHYRAYLKKSPKGEHAEMVRKWLARGERTLLKQLMDRYPEDVDILMGKTGIASGSPAAVSPREAYFIRRIKELSAENLRLQGTVSQISAKLNRLEPPVSAIPGATNTSLSQMPITEKSDLSNRKPNTSSTLSPAGMIHDEGPLIDPAEGEMGPAATALPGATADGMTSPLTPQGDGPEKTVRVPPATVSVPSGPNVSAMKSAVSATPPVESVAVDAGGRSFVPIKRLTPGGSSGVTTSPAIVRMYTVRNGDTLSGIARKFYGRSTAWRDILEANRKVLPNEAALKPGLKLMLPPLVGTPTKERHKP